MPEHHAQQPMFRFVSSTKRFAQGEAATTFAGSTLASNLNECSPFPYGDLVLQWLVAEANAWNTWSLPMRSIGSPAEGNEPGRKPAPKKACSASRSARNQFSMHSTIRWHWLSVAPPGAAQWSPTL